MTDCKTLIIKDITPWNGDVFDHPIYEYSCKLTKKKIIPHVHCNCKRCENYVSVDEDKEKDRR